MESLDKEGLDRIVRELQEEISVLQIKVSALESLVLNDDETRTKYTKLVSEQADALIRERKGKLE
jgi:hypothetical protein